MEEWIYDLSDGGFGAGDRVGNGGGGYLNVYEGVLVYAYSFWRVRVDFVWGGRAWLF